MNSKRGTQRHAVAPARAAMRPVDPGQPPGTRPDAELAHELEVHRVELEMQNEELRQAQLELAAARDRFVDLYDFAPVGYCTLDEAGLVTEANLTVATMLGVARNRLLGRGFSRYVTPAHVERWQRERQHATVGDASQRIELVLQNGAGETFHGQLDCVPRLQPDGMRTLRVTLTDVTQRKLAEQDRQMALAEQDLREAERRRVARELHEGLGQRLGALKMELSALPLHGDAADACRERVAAMLDSLDRSVASVRQIATDLRPLMLDDLGLGAAIDWLAHDVGQRLGLELQVDIEEPRPAPDERTAIALYRLAQHILEHVGHAATFTRLAVSLTQHAHEMVLAFRCTSPPRAVRAAAPPPASRPKSEHSLHQRARQLGARLEILDTPGNSLSIVVQMPVPRNATGDRPIERRTHTGDRRRTPTP